ncbi:alpha/beta fold hydrolase [Halomonas halocynthiae]|uniref:alpha/beta fold hydrolase n=1 Tax=Halomonas halocynthiae TaxID=176290 RepID=UPI0003F52CDA|nr:alpha/beta hydrolase [Halomonas halocynthiae]
MDSLRLLKVQDLEVAVRIWHPDAPRTVIAWHGLARHGGDFNALARKLGPQWRVIAPDTPGRGLSSWSPVPDQHYLYDHYMTIAVAVLNHFNLDSVPWVGTSMGGLLGMRLASDTEHAGRVERLMLNDVGPALNPDALTLMGNYFAQPYRFNQLSELENELRQNYATFGIESEKTWAKMARDSARRLPDGGWSFHYDPRIAEQFIHDTPRDNWADWQAIHCPLMLLRGANSSLLDRQTAEQMQAMQPAMLSLEAEGCGHAPMLDRTSQVEALRQFIEG